MIRRYAFVRTEGSALQHGTWLSVANCNARRAVLATPRRVSGVLSRSVRSVGTYEVLRTLARGGMAELLLARAEGPHGFRKVVVLKRIHSHLADDPGFVEMFRDEARLAALLDHPNVVQVFDIGDGDDGVFFAMEYLRGADVRALLEATDGALPLAHALTIVTGAAAGLHHAHSRLGLDGRPLAVIHRDVSPTNVFVTYDGAVKVLDFGIAKATSNERHTQHSRLKGKIAYMSPEQCAGAPLDARADVFSLGAVLYELTTGHRPYDGASEFALMNAIVNHPVTAPEEHVADYPAALQTIVLRAMAQQAEQRYASAAQMRRELEEFARGSGLTLSTEALGDFAAACVPADHELAAAIDSVDAVVEAPTAPTVVSPIVASPIARPNADRQRVLLIAGAGLVTALAFGVAWTRNDDREQPPAAVAAPPSRVPAARVPAAAAPAPDPQPPEPEAPPREEPVLPAALPEPTPVPAVPVPEARVRTPTKRKRRAAPKVEPTPIDGDGWVPIRRKGQ